MDRKIKIRLTALLSLFLLSFSSWFFDGVYSESNDYLQVTFFSVGQGDAIYIETPSGVQALIDGGPNSSVLLGLSREMGWFDNSIDIVLGTHQDLDHVAGLVDVLERYDVDAVVLTEGKGASDASKAFVAEAAAEGAQLVYARSGQNIILDASTTIEILSPADSPAEWDSNTGSIVFMLHYGDTSFVFTGDAPVGIEEYLVRAEGSHLKADVLKLGHHGSKTSSSALFLETVSPDFAVVSAGKDNRYGHPHPDVLERVEENTKAQVVSTAEQGDITFFSDGVKVWLK